MPSRAKLCLFSSKLVEIRSVATGGCGGRGMLKIGCFQRSRGLEFERFSHSILINFLHLFHLDNIMSLEPVYLYLPDYIQL